MMNPKEVYLSKPWLKYYSEGVPAELISRNYPCRSFSTG